MPNEVPQILATKDELVLRLGWRVDLALTVASHGWVHLAPWRWDSETGRLSRAERIGNRVGRIEVRQDDPRAVAILWEGFDLEGKSEIMSRVERWLSVDWDPSAAMLALPDAATLIERGGGRILRCSTFYEDFVKTVLTINTSWSSTCRMSAALVAEPGDGAFPSPLELLEYGEKALRERAKLGFRAPTVVAATRQMLDDGAISESGEGLPGRLEHDYLLSLRGIGPYAAAHCRVLLQDFSRIPVDSSVLAYLRERYGCDSSQFVGQRSSWGDFIALGYRLARLRERLERAGPAGSD